MRRPAFALSVCLVSVFLLLAGGCEAPAPMMPSEPVDANAPDIPMCAFYCPASVSILPLTGFAPPETNQEPSTLHIYVSLLDAFTRQIKYPAEFRFELYKYVQFVSDNKGERLIGPTIWPDLKLNDPQANDYYWEDYLRAYHFEFKFDLGPVEPPYVLEVTCKCGYGKRLSATLELK